MQVLQIALLLLLIGGYSIASPVDSTLTKTPQDESYWLNGDFIPFAYDVNFRLDDDFVMTRKFMGKVTINVARETSNSKIMQIHMTPEIVENVLIEIDGVLLDPNTTTYNAITNIMSIIIEDTNKNEFECKFKWTGRLYDDMYGFYLSKVSSEFIATTQFHPTFARRAFPCFDEPQYKSKFTIAVTVPVGYMAISNQPRKSGENGQTFNFEETPSMSTYLVALVVSKFEKYEVSASKSSTFQMDIWAPANLKANAKYAVSVSRKIIDKLGEILGGFEKMGIKHLDQVVIPDHAAGAMENWGLVTYCETALLVNPAHSKVKDREHVATMIAHEFAHNWFGNWITPKWWSDSWLSEGFATFFETFGLVDIPELKAFELDKQFVLNVVHPIMEIDGNTGAPPLSSADVDVNTVDEILARFGSISYNKGGAIVRMVEKMVGTTEFMAKMKKYIADNQGKNTGTNELFKDFAPMVINGKSVTFENIMKNWVYESGYPVVTAVLKDDKVVVKQEQFLYNNEETSVKKFWYVPITYEISGERSTESTRSTILHILEPCKEENIVVEDLRNEVVIINPENEGYYRVNYDMELWNRIITMLKNDHQKISVITRAQLINDAMNLARVNQLDYSIAMTLLEYLENETEYYPWHAAFTAFSYLRKRLVGDNLRDDITKLMNGTMKKFYEANKEFKVDEREGAIAVYTKVLALEWACELDNEDCVSKATELFPAPTRDNANINANLESIVYCAGLRHSKYEVEDWNMLWDKYESSTNAAEKATILTSLGCTKNTDLLNKFLEKSINGEFRAQDASSVFKAVLAGNPEGIDVAFDFLKKNLRGIREYYGSMGALSSVILQLSDRLTTEAQVDEFETFLNYNQDQLGEAALVAGNALKTAEANLKWAATAKSNLKDYLDHSGDDDDDDDDDNDNDDDGNNGSSSSSFNLSFNLNVALNISSNSNHSSSNSIH